LSRITADCAVPSYTAATENPTKFLTLLGLTLTATYTDLNYTQTN
jgi:hypothetical protein